MHPEEHGTGKEVAQFVRQCYSFFELLKKHPEMLQKTGKRKHVGPCQKAYYANLSHQAKKINN